MTEMDARPTPPLPNPRTDDGQEVMPPRGAVELDARTAPEMASSGAIQVATFNAVITAQRVAVPRDIVAVQNRLRVLASTFSDLYVYSWDVKSAQGGKSEISGPTIKLANDLAREYGNCVIDMAVDNNPDNWVFHARFTDLETGYSQVRLFQQRKNQNLGGRMDADRKLDMSFQIGQSKAIRNVVVNSLQTYTTFMVEEAERSVLVKVSNDKDKVWEFINNVLERHGVKLHQIEAHIGRRSKDWTIRNLATVYMQVRGIHEGMSDPKELYADAEQSTQIQGRQDREEAGDRESAAQHNAADEGGNQSGLKKQNPDDAAVGVGTDGVVKTAGESAENDKPGDKKEDGSKTQTSAKKAAPKAKAKRKKADNGDDTLF